MLVAGYKFETAVTAIIQSKRGNLAWSSLIRTCRNVEVSKPFLCQHIVTFTKFHNFNHHRRLDPNLQHNNQHTLGDHKFPTRSGALQVVQI